MTATIEAQMCIDRGEVAFRSYIEVNGKCVWLSPSYPRKKQAIEHAEEKLKEMKPK